MLKKIGEKLREIIQGLIAALIEAKIAHVEGAVYVRSGGSNDDTDRENPLEGVELRFDAIGGDARVTTQTEGNGHYSVVLAHGEYEVSASHHTFTDYDPVPRTITVADSSDAVDIYLEPKETDGTTRLHYDLKLGRSDRLPRLPIEASEPSTEVEEYDSSKTGEIRTRTVRLPGDRGTAELTYEVIDGLAIMEGDIVLGKVDEIEVDDSPSENPEDIRQSRLGLLASTGRGGVCQQLWPDAIVPYLISTEIAGDLRNRIASAMAEVERETNVQFVPAGAGYEDFVEFVYYPGSGAGAANVGRQGGKQHIWLKNGAREGTVIHEILHTLGIFHEQSRNDRDVYVDIHWDNIRDNKGHNFEKHSATGLDIGEYDYRSIMHYPRTAFGKDDPSGSGRLDTITPTSSSAVIGLRGGLSTKDVDGLRSLYPYHRLYEGGLLWGSSNYATSIAFGDVDGDGKDEVGIVRRAGENTRFWVVDIEEDRFRTLLSGGNSWGSSNYATDIAFGDVDGDGRDEIGIARKAGDNMRYSVLEYDASDDDGYNTVYSGGEQWGSSAYATGIAFGDVDGDGLDEVGITRRAGQGMRYRIRDDAQNGFEELYSGGSSWGSSNYATAIAFGDVDGDGRDEVGITRKAGENMRFRVRDGPGGSFASMHTGGDAWGDAYWATDIAFGDVDGDGKDELGVTRKAAEGGRYWIYDDFTAQFDSLYRGGDSWGSSYYATGIDFGDVDGDGREEIAITRNADENARFWVRDDDSENYSVISCGGYNWGTGNYGTAIAIGNDRGTSNPTLGVARNAVDNGRYFVHEFRE